MSFTRWNRYRRTRIQKRKALQLLALSGVVRPSTNEPRYTLSPLKVAAIHERPAQTLITQNIPGRVQSQAPQHPRHIKLAVIHLVVTARAWCEQSLQHLRPLLHWDVGKAAGRVIGFPSVR